MGRYIEERYGRTKLVRPKESDTHLIARMTVEGASRLSQSGEFRAGGTRFRTVLTSGSIGKLKKGLKPADALDDGKVP